MPAEGEDRCPRMYLSSAYSLRSPPSPSPLSPGSRTTIPCHPIHVVTERKRHCALQKTFRRESASTAMHPVSQGLQNPLAYALSVNSIRKPCPTLCAFSPEKKSALPQAIITAA